MAVQVSQRMRFSDNHFLAIFVLTLIVFLSPTRSLSATALNFEINYSVSVAHVPIGVSALTETGDGSNYHLTFSAELTGIPRMLFASKIKADAEGLIAKDHLSPSHYGFFIDYPKDPMRVDVLMASGTVTNATITPPQPPRADRVPLLPEHRQNIIDPLSAFLVPVKGEMNASSICNQTANIFDGAARFDISLQPNDNKVADLAGYKGPVTTCNIRYTPIAGHQEKRANVKFMRDNHNISVDLIPLKGYPYLVPVKIEVETMIGNLRIEAQSIKGIDTSPMQISQ